MKKHFNIGVIGKTGSGKSVYTAKLIKYFYRTHHKRIIVLDSLEQLYPMLPFKFEKIDNYTSFSRMISKENFLISVSFPESRFYNSNFFEVLWNIRNYILVIDEISLFCDVHFIPYYLKELTQRGRTREIRMLYNTQRVNNVSRNLTSQSDFIIAFKLTEKTDLKQFEYKDFDVISNLAVGEYKIIRGTPYDYDAIIDPEILKDCKIRKMT